MPFFRYLRKITFEVGPTKMHHTDENALGLKTRALYAEQSYIARQENLQKELMVYLGGTKKVLNKAGKIGPTCYLCYAWPTKENEEKKFWVQPFLSTLYDHLTAASILVIMNIRDMKPIENIYHFTHQYYDGNPIILIGTETLLQKSLGNTPYIEKTELTIISRRSEEDQKIYGCSRICSLLISGTIDTSFPKIFGTFYRCDRIRVPRQITMFAKLAIWTTYR
jgi:hypothetical protein